jgi:hypothetical protein
MTFAEISELIRKHYRYASPPTEAEVRSILAEVSRLQSNAKVVSEGDLWKIINSNRKDKRVIILDAVDPTPAASVLKQILDAAKSQIGTQAQKK